MSNVLLEPGAVTCQGLVSIEGPLPDGSCCRDGEEGTRREGAFCLVAEVWLGPTRDLGNWGCKVTLVAWRGPAAGQLGPGPLPARCPWCISLPGGVARCPPCFSPVTLLSALPFSSDAVTWADPDRRQPKDVGAAAPWRQGRALNREGPLTLRCP